MKRSIRQSISALKGIQSQYLLGDDVFDVATSMLMIKFLSTRADAAFEELISGWMDEGMSRKNSMALALSSDLPHYPKDLQRWAGLTGQPEGEIASGFVQICSELNQLDALSGLFEFARLEKIQKYPGGALRDIIAWVDRGTKERSLERAPELFEELLNTVMNTRLGTAATHPILCDLMVSLLDVTGDFYVYDPACGVGELLIETMRRAETNQIETVLCGQELNEETLRLCRLRLAFKTELSPNIASGHTLLAPGHPRGTELRTYDRIICDVPFSGVIDQHDLRHDKYGRFAVSSTADSKTRLYLSFIEHVLATMGANGKAVLLVPGSLLYGGGAEAQMREVLVESSVLESAILLPKMWLSKFTSAAVIVLSKSDRIDVSSEDVVFVDATVYDRHGRTLMSKLVLEEVVALARGAETSENVQAISKETLRNRSYVIQLDQVQTVLSKDKDVAFEDEIASLRESHGKLCDQLSASLRKLNELVNDHA